MWLGGPSGVLQDLGLLESSGLVGVLQERSREVLVPAYSWSLLSLFLPSIWLNQASFGSVWMQRGAGWRSNPKTASSWVPTKPGSKSALSNVGWCKQTSGSALRGGLAGPCFAKPTAPQTAGFGA